MKLYIEQDPAPNPRRVRIFLAEKRITDIELVRVDMLKGEHKSPPHLRRNSLGQLPVLELGDGRMLSESIAICRYLEALFPEPSLFGRDPFEAATIEMWTRRIEIVLAVPVGMFWRHAHWRTAKLLTQFNDFGESNRDRAETVMRWLDQELGSGHGYIAGDRFSIADIVAVTTIDFAKFIGLPMPADCNHLQAWRSRMAERPSVAMPAGLERRYIRPEELQAADSATAAAK